MPLLETLAGGTLAGVLGDMFGSSGASDDIARANAQIMRERLLRDQQVEDYRLQMEERSSMAGALERQLREQMNEAPVLLGGDVLTQNYPRITY